nr:hypothetical protein [Salidesulfovibrio brasiliensis]
MEHATSKGDAFGKLFFVKNVNRFRRPDSGCMRRTVEVPKCPVLSINRPSCQSSPCVKAVGSCGSSRTMTGLNDGAPAEAAVGNSTATSISNRTMRGMASPL